MKHTQRIKKGLLPFALSALLGIPASAQLTENFDNITTLTGAGWFMQNNSQPVGSTGWFQGNNTVFAAFNGAATAYIGANYNNTGNTGTISNWLIAPTMTLRNGDVIAFYTRQAVSTYADRLQVCMSTNGASTNVGTTATSVGDFSTLLLDINPTLTGTGYPEAWTLYSITISGLTAPTSGRIAFRYFVTNAGFSGTNSDYIGIDNFVWTPYVCPTLTVTGSLAGGTAGSAYSQTLGQTGALGTPSYAVTAGSLPPGLTLSTSGTISGTPTATGTYNFTVTVSDASGCSGSQAYSISIACPTGGASLSAFPALCDNGPLYTLVEGSPAGGTYSGTGVTGGMFDPASGSQSITYSLTDIYGCPQSTAATLTVNTAPTVALTPFTAVCDNGGMVTLTGESPSGGTWSGTGVTGNMFDPASGSQAITYTYTDGNGCSNMASETFPVNAAPTVTLTPFTAVCDNGGMVTLGGESPAGGTWSGTGVTGNMFDPASGSQSIMYTYTDSNGCTNMATEMQMVNAAPTVALTPFMAVCSNSGMVTLTGESPAGGTWSGTGVSGNMFDPSSGTQTIMYAYTDSNGCSDSDSMMFTVNMAPTVSLTPFTPVCSNGGSVTLSGESPAGGTWSGTGVSGTTFDAANGTQVITYTYTDSLGCSDSASQTLVVNAAPTVTLAPFTSQPCEDDGPSALTGGSPAGGTYSGTGVNGGMFDPSAAGTFPIMYTYTDTNGCTNSATQNITVDDCVGILEYTAGGTLECYPNPNSGVFTVRFSQENAGDLTISVLSLEGKVLSRQQRGDVNGIVTMNFDLGSLAQGIYMLEAQTSLGRTVQKIVVQ